MRTPEQVHWFDEPEPGEVLIGIWRGHDVLSPAIKLFSHGIGTHAAFIAPGVGGVTWVTENFWPRVRQRPLYPSERRQVEEYRIAGSTPGDWLLLRRWLAHEAKHPSRYSILDLFRYAINLPPLPGRRGFCSMFVMQGLRECLPPCKQPLVRLEYRDYASPAMLRTSPLLIRRKSNS